MLKALLGSEWEQMEGDVTFSKAPVDSWVLAAETMLAAADAADPIRVAIRGLMQESTSDRDGAAMPKPE